MGLAKGWPLIVISLVLLLGTFVTSEIALGSPEDPMRGSRVFGAKGCSSCHSVNGIGGKIGPDLARIQHSRSFNNLAAVMWNHLPQMAAQMKKQKIPVPHFKPREIGDLIAFLFTLNYFARPGNVDKGKKLFSEKRCIVCHQVGGVGGVLGPSLDALGQTATPIGIAAAMWNHGPAMSEAMESRNIKRPHFAPSELRDLVAYFRNLATSQPATPVNHLPGRAMEGALLFEKKQCVKCHSVKGKGANLGPDLGRRGLHRDVIDFAAGLWNKAPAMIKIMKERNIPVPQLEAGEMADIIAYLRSVQYFNEPGNALRGRQLVSSKRCLNCHGLEGTGANSAPDFAMSRELDSSATVIAALWNHLDLMVQPTAEANFPWSSIRPHEMNDLVAFFRSLKWSKP